MKVKEMIKVLKYDCFHVTLKIIPLLVSKVALFMTQVYWYSICWSCLFYVYWIRSCGKWGLPKDGDLKSACNPHAPVSYQTWSKLFVTLSSVKSYVFILNWLCNLFICSFFFFSPNFKMSKCSEFFIMI